MVQVYLPLGYPQISGVGFANVLYQGNTVRLYSVPTDPRSGAQLENRRLLSDVSKMRGAFGTWARGVCKAVYGSRWSTVLWQIIKADIESWWSNAVDEWEGFTSVNQDAWRAAAPFQATHNDPGQIFFGMARVLARSMLHYVGVGYRTSIWTQAQHASAVEWWTHAVGGYAQEQGTSLENSSYLSKIGAWSVLVDPSPPNWNYLRTTAAGAKLGLYCYGRQVTYKYKLLGDYGMVSLKCDSTHLANFQLVNYNNVYAVQLPYKGVHYFELEVITPNVTFESFEVA